MLQPGNCVRPLTEPAVYRIAKTQHKQMNLVLKIKRAETPFYAWLKRSILRALRLEVPLPALFTPILRGVAAFSALTVQGSRRLLVAFYRAPLFRTYCETVGRGLYLEQSPHISGHTRITVGENVCISGDLSIASSHVLERPELIIGNRVFIGHQTIIKASQRVVIEDDVLIAGGCYIADSDDHPKDPLLRAQGHPAAAEAMKPVQICRYAWIGRSSFILKGVTIGEGAIVGAASVVVKDVPPYCIAAGNPAAIVGRID
jgi:acetyltransferase-like isoleucine patch superfamily enzyme